MVFLSSLIAKLITKLKSVSVLFCKYRRYVCAALAVFILAGIFLLFLKVSSSGKSALALTFESEASDFSAAGSSKVLALNRNGKKGSVLSKKGSSAYFAFTDEQKKKIAAEFSKNGDGAFSLLVKVKKLSEKQLAALSGMKESGIQKNFSFGFLYEEDFLPSGKLKKNIGGRALVSADLTDFSALEDQHFTVCMCLPSDSKIPDESGILQKIPCGFFVYSSLPVSFPAVQFGRAAVGWNISGNFYAFAPNGGTVVRGAASFDFSGASLVFPAQNTEKTVLPQFFIGFDRGQGSAGSEENFKTIKVAFGGETFSFYRTNSKNQSSFQVLPAAALKNCYQIVTPGENSHLINSILLKASSPDLLKLKDRNVLKPIKADPGLIISWNSSSWRGRDYELFEWDLFPKILIFDIRSYSVQDDFFRRLAFYVEKAGYRGRLLTDMELGSLHGYNAHDYSAESLANFFEKARTEGFALNPKEYLLCDILVENGIILRSSDGSYSAGSGAVISISQESPQWLRRTFLAHECWHGIFFIDADFRNAVGAVYYTMDPVCLEFLKQFWSTQATLSYDTSDIYLMHNELMGYLMQQSLRETKRYFVSVANRGSVQRNQKATADYVIKTQAAGFEDSAKILDTYAFDNWGYGAGRVWLISR